MDKEKEHKERKTKEEKDKKEDEKLFCRKKISLLTSKKDVYFTKRCNKSIDLAVAISLKILNKEEKHIEGKTKEEKDKEERVIYIQEEGGWMTYRNYAKKHNLTLVLLKMKDGKIEDSELKKLAREERNGIILMHSLPGYSYEEDMQKIMKNKGRNILINDCCGSIGTESAKIGDIIVCSFGDAKPLSAGGGGFISLNEFELLESNLSNSNSSTKISNSFSDLSEEEEQSKEKINFFALAEAIKTLDKRLSFWKEKSENVKSELKNKGFSVINKEKEGINVLVSFKDEEEKERLINYCKEQGIEYTECPRYIRTIKKALSLEIKRLKC